MPSSRTEPAPEAPLAALREEITAIEPEARRVTTDQGEHQADVLVIALGAGAPASKPVTTLGCLGCQPGQAGQHKLAGAINQADP